MDVVVEDVRARAICFFFVCAFSPFLDEGRRRRRRRRDLAMAVSS